MQETILIEAFEAAASALENFQASGPPRRRRRDSAQGLLGTTMEGGNVAFSSARADPSTPAAAAGTLPHRWDWTWFHPFPCHRFGRQVA